MLPHRLRDFSPLLLGIVVLSSWLVQQYITVGAHSGEACLPHGSLREKEGKRKRETHTHH